MIVIIVHLLKFLSQNAGKIHTLLNASEFKTINSIQLTDNKSLFIKY